MGSYIFSFFIILALFISGCSKSEEHYSVVDLSNSYEKVSSLESRELSPDVSSTDTETLINGNNSFAIEMFHQLLNENDGNIVFSPYSVSSAFALLYPGTSGDTKSEIKNTLHFNLDDGAFLKAFNKIDLDITKDGENYTLKGANGVWPDRDFSVKTDYLNTIMVNFGGELYALDYSKSSADAAEIINSWVKNNTGGKIEEILSESDIDPSTKLILTNAVYFKGKWAKEFSQYETGKMDFTLSDGSAVSADMMTQNDYFQYAGDTAYQAISLPYLEGYASFVAIAPYADSRENFLSGFNSTVFQNIIDTMSSKKVNLFIPKFSFSSPKYTLGSMLQNLGIHNAFDGSSDFSNLTDEDVEIKEVFHKAFVSIDEEGAEATAVTAITTGPSAAPPSEEELVTFIINRPFLFFIRDDIHGQILFMGLVVNPNL